MIGSNSLGQAFPTLEAIGQAKGAAKKVFAIIEQKSGISYMSDSGETIRDVKGEINLRNVHFKYPARPDVPVSSLKLLGIWM